MLNRNYNTKIKIDKNFLSIRIPKPIIRDSEIDLNCSFRIDKKSYEGIDIFIISKQEDGYYKINDGLIKINKNDTRDLGINCGDIMNFTYKKKKNIVFSGYRKIRYLINGFWIIEEINSLYKEGLISSDIKRANFDLYKKATNRFGTWKNIENKLGISYGDYRPTKWTKEKIFECIMKLKTNGEALTYTNLSKHSRSMCKSIVRQFGSVENLISDLGMDYFNELRKKTSVYVYCGHLFEKIVDNLLRTLSIKFIKYGNGDYKPDYIFDDCKWGDAKLSESTVFNPLCDTIKNYEPRCTFLTIIYFRGNKDKDEMLTDKTRIISVYKLIKQLPKNKRKIFLNQLDDLEQKILKSNYKEDIKHVSNNNDEHIKEFIKNITYKKYKKIEGSRKSANRKLSDNQVIEIKELLNSKQFSCRSIGKYYGVSLKSIRQIRDGESYKDIIGMECDYYRFCSN